MRQLEIKIGQLTKFEFAFDNIKRQIVRNKKKKRE